MTFSPCAHLNRDALLLRNFTMAGEKDSTIVRIAPYHYVHILNLNTNVTRLLIGPRTYVCLNDEKIILGPQRMVCLRAMRYCIISDPIARLSNGEPVVDSSGQVKLQKGTVEFRFTQDPFPLYPGESLKGSIQDVPVVPANSAFLLEASIDFVDEEGSKRVAGEQWTFEGPATYYPRKEVLVVKIIDGEKIEPNTALCMRASRNCVDRNGNKRIFGERWLVRNPGIYIPGAYEEVIEKRKAHKLDEMTAIRVKALITHIDDFGKKRKCGDEWLITAADADSHICSVNEEFVETVYATVLNSHEYCVVNNPVDDNGVPQLGRKKLVRGETAFFLRPEESLNMGVQSSFILGDEDGLIVQADEQFVDEVESNLEYGEDEGPAPKRTIIRRPGVQWMIRGPMEYIPPVEVHVVTQRELIPLDVNEGIYVRNKKTGEIRAVIGEAYMLNQDEELWEKELPPEVIQLLAENKDPLADRGTYARKNASSSPEEIDLTRVVTFQVPHNAAVQIYDYKEKKARVEFGPTLVMLGPNEQFTRLSLSGGKPKRPNVIKSLCLLLGPDFCTDVIVVETADHARLSLQLSYNWHFAVPKPCGQEDAAKLFSVHDFVGDLCKAIASRVRGAVASVQFDDFHKNSARIIRTSVFGFDTAGKVRDQFVFTQNNLHVTSVDVQSVEPVDQRTRESLQKSVQLAIEITTNSQEASARQEAERLEQEARGRLERQKIEDESAAEEARCTLVETRVQLAALESCGQAAAEAQSHAEASRIEGMSGIEQARLRAAALEIETNAELERLKKAREAELAYMSEKMALEEKYKKEDIRDEVTRFTAMIQSLGQDTLRSIATAGSEQNVRMLSALGLQSTLITDGNTPINLLTTANGLIGKLTDRPERSPRGEHLMLPPSED